MAQFPVSTSNEQSIDAALELSKNSWLLAIQVPGRDNPSLHPISGGDTSGLMAKLDAARDRLAKVSGQVPKVILCYEAGYDGFWLARFLEQRGIECLVMESASLQVNRRARRVKTDRVDVENLLHTLIAWCRGERHVCSIGDPERRGRGSSPLSPVSGAGWSARGRLTSTGSRACCLVRAFVGSTSNRATRAWCRRSWSRVTAGPLEAVSQL